jgi:hypothetical protein
MLALERYVAGDLGRALDYLDVQALPDDYRYWLMKAVVHSGAGQEDEARQAWNALIQIKPGYSENVCEDLRHSNIHHTYYNQIVADLSKIVRDLPEESCGTLAVASDAIAPAETGQ